MTAKRTRRRTPWWRYVLVAIALWPVFSAALVAAALLHLNVPAARRAAAGIVNGVLAEQLWGTVRVGAIERLGAGGIAVGELTIDDEQGVRVLTAHGAELRGPGWLGLASLLGDAPLLVVPSLSLDDAELDLALDESGRLGIDRALSDKPGPPGPPAPPTPPALAIWLERLALGRVHVIGKLPGEGRAIDATLAGFAGSAALGLRDIRFEIESADLAESGILGANASA